MNHFLGQFCLLGPSVHLNNKENLDWKGYYELARASSIPAPLPPSFWTLYRLFAHFDYYNYYHY